MSVIPVGQLSVGKDGNLEIADDLKGGAFEAQRDTSPGLRPKVLEMEE